jgi:PAS domain S-box-containing protein
VFGYTSEEAIGELSGLLFTPEDRAKGFDTHELEIARSTGHAEDDRWHVRKDGTRIWVTGSVRAVTDEAGGILGFVKIARDRTDLQARIERQEQLLAGQQTASSRTHAFLRTLGHEMRNPLTPLTNAAHIIRKVSTDRHLDRVADIIDSQVGALQRMADDLMDVARLDLGKVRLQRERIDLRTVLDQACTTFREAANAKGVTLVGLLPRGALVAEVDPARFQQVIHNLLTNAIRYTPAGGAVWLKATQEEGDVVIKVEDTGVGISSEMLPRLFDLFTRDPGAAELEPSGLGVGLAVVKAVMELHGGSAQAKSSGPGKGAEFAIRLPAA